MSGDEMHKVTPGHKPTRVQEPTPSQKRASATVPTGWLDGAKIEALVSEGMRKKYGPKAINAQIENDAYHYYLARTGKPADRKLKWAIQQGVRRIVVKNVFESRYFCLVEGVLGISLSPNSDKKQILDIVGRDVTRIRSGRPLPVYRSIVGDGGSILVEAIAAETREASAKTATYGVRMSGDNMEPAYYSNDILWIDPILSPQPRKDVMLEPTDPDADRRRFICHLVSETPLEWVVIQHKNPQKRFHIRKAEWPQARRIVGCDRAE
jgi:hypothetical protein